MTCHIYYINEINQKKEFICYKFIQMQKIDQIILTQSSQSRKELLHAKRLKAKQKTNIPPIKTITKQDLRKQRNRHAAQKSRDRKKEYLQNLQSQNQRLKTIISRCSICSTLEFNNRPQQRIDDYEHEHQDQQPILINQTPPTFVNQTFIREQVSNQESSSNLSQYFWFGCLVVLVCLANYQTQDISNANRQLFNDPTANLPKLWVNESIINKKPTISAENSKALMQKMQNKPNYCQLCLQCLRNISRNYGNISLYGNQTKQIINATNTSSKILYCKSKAKFFQKIYQALNEKQQQNKSRQITRVLIKGKLLNDLMEQECFLGEEINQDQQYLISFSVAILQMAPVKASRKSRLSIQQ